MQIIQYMKDDSRAVVTARDVADGYYQLHLHAREDWSTATHFIICECRNSLTPRVLAVEEGLDTICEAHRLLGKVVPADQNEMIQWAVRSEDPVYTNAGAAFHVLNEVV